MALIEIFLKYIRYELNLSTHTVLSYKNDLKQFCEFLKVDDCDLDVATLDANDIRAWMVDLTKNGDTARTIRRKIQAIRAFLKFCLKRGYVDANVASDIEMAKVKKKLPSFIRKDWMDAFLDTEIDEADFIEVRDRLIVEMFYETGIRRAELMTLKDEWVDYSRMELKVHGKRDKDRIIPFGALLADKMMHYQKLRNEKVGRYCEFFFVRSTGKELYPTLIYKIVHNQLLAAGGAGKLSPHVLRHTFASAMLNDGAEINSVKEILGHSSLSATQVYTHITISELKQNYQQAHPRAIKKGG